MIVFGQFLAFSMNAVVAHMQGGPTVTLTGDAVDASGHVLGHAGTSVAWETVQAAVNIADVAGTGNGLTWRYMLVLCSLPAIALWIGIRTVPESSRWYAANLRIVEAIGSLKRVRDEKKDDVAGEINEMLDVQRAESAQEKWSLSQILKVKWARNLLYIGIVLGIADQLTGINTAMYYTPKILNAAGVPMEDAITLNVVSGGISAIGSVARRSIRSPSRGHVSGARHHDFSGCAVCRVCSLHQPLPGWRGKHLRRPDLCALARSWHRLYLRVHQAVWNGVLGARLRDIPCRRPRHCPRYRGGYSVACQRARSRCFPTAHGDRRWRWYVRDLRSH